MLSDLHGRRPHLVAGEAIAADRCHRPPQLYSIADVSIQSFALFTDVTHGRRNRWRQRVAALLTEQFPDRHRRRSAALCRLRADQAVPRPSPPVSVHSPCLFLGTRPSWPPFQRARRPRSQGGVNGYLRFRAVSKSLGLPWSRKASKPKPQRKLNQQLKS